jgi:hypothetical protein
MINATTITLNSNTATAAGTITVGTVSATGAIIGSGNLTATTLTMSTATTNTFIGERAYLQFTFTSSASTAGTIALPFAGQVIDCWVTVDTATRACSGFTLYTGNSASGTVAVASVALAFTTIGQQIQATLTPAAAITATALAFVVTTAGTAATFYGVVTLQRTA